MADRRLSPAELKARLQANLAVAGAKSNNPVPAQPSPSPAESTPARALVTPLETPSVTPSETSLVTSLVTPLETPLDTPLETPLETPLALPTAAPVATAIAASTAEPPAETEPNSNASPLTETNSGPLDLQPSELVAPPRKRAATTAVTVPKRSTRPVLHRRDRGAVLRGYRIPVDLHRQAERAKLGLASRRGTSLFWDELLQSAIDLLLDDTQRIAQELSAARRSPELGAPSTRVLQAAIRHDQDFRLRMLRIDLEELDGATVRLEEIWTWLISQVVKNEG